MTISEIDRMFFEVLRLRLVSGGFLPDVTLYANASAYEQAKQAIITANRQIIDLFGVGAGDSRATVIGNRITIDRIKQERGSIAGGTTEMVKTGQTWKEVQIDDFSRDLVYEIRVIARNANYFRVAEDIVNYEIGERRYLSTIGENGLPTPDKVLTEWTGSVDVSSTTEYLESMHRFVVSDVWLMKEKVLRTGIPALSSVDYFVYLKSSESNYHLNTSIQIKEQ